VVSKDLLITFTTNSCASSNVISSLQGRHTSRLSLRLQKGERTASQPNALVI
jgi:hypothetical protein